MGNKESSVLNKDNEPNAVLVKLSTELEAVICAQKNEDENEPNLNEPNLFRMVTDQYEEYLRDFNIKLPQKVQDEFSGNCPICWESVMEEDLVTITTCGHYAGCISCFSEFISQNVSEGNVTPWLVCPKNKCDSPLAPDNLCKPPNEAATKFKLPISISQSFLICFLSKRLSKYPQWVQCENSACNFGFAATSKKELVTCIACGKEQYISDNRRDKLDPDMAKLIEKGQLRACPKCGHYDYKEYGMCNILQCAPCGTWWNWRTRATGRSRDELKKAARAQGTLWEKGELEYQQKLQATNPAAFRALLERNGVKYDPKYRRGR